jgi:DNA-binding transcriptional ArsR family regulator
MKSKEKVKKQPIKLSDPKLKKVLLNHWQNIPVIKEIPEPMPTKLIKQEIRSEILDVLREGVQEYDENNNIVEIRYAFSVKELHKLIKERIKTRIKISNVYFHLNRLREKGYIEIITSISEGRQTTHYFGRTARLFLWMGEPLETKKIAEDTAYLNFVTLLKQFKPNLTSEFIEELYTSFIHARLEGHQRIKQWIKKNEEQLVTLNMDTRDLYQFLKSIDNCTTTIIEVNNKIARLLDFPTG